MVREKLAHQKKIKTKVGISSPLRSKTDYKEIVTRYTTQQSSLQSEGATGVHTLQGHKVEDLVDRIVCPNYTDVPESTKPHLACQLRLSRSPVSNPYFLISSRLWCIRDKRVCVHLQTRAGKKRFCHERQRNLE